jgi:hypothetical protein
VEELQQDKVKSTQTLHSMRSKTQKAIDLIKQLRNTEAELTEKNKHLTSALDQEVWMCVYVNVYVMCCAVWLLESQT